MCLFLTPPRGGAFIQTAPRRALDQQFAERPEHPNLHAKICEIATAPMEGRGFDWAGILFYVEGIVEKFSGLLKLIESLMIAPDLSAEKKSQVVDLLKVAHAELRKNSVFLYFIAQNGGKEFLEAENAIAKLQRDETQGQLQAFQRWVCLTHEIASDIAKELKS